MVKLTLKRSERSSEREQGGASMESPEELIARRLAQDQIDVRTARDKIDRELAEPRQLPLDAASLMRSDVGALVSLPGPEGLWKKDLPVATERVAGEMEKLVLRRTKVYAEAAGLALADAVVTVDSIAGGLVKEVERRRAKLEAAFDKASRSLERNQEPTEKQDRPGLWSSIASLFEGVADRVRAAKAWNDREVVARRIDVHGAELAVWQRVRGTLQKLPDRLSKLEVALVACDRQAELGDAVVDRGEGHPHRGLSWEPVGRLANHLVGRDPEPSLPADLLLALAEDEEVALELIEEEAVLEGRRDAALLRLGALTKVHGPILHAAGQEMLRALNRGAGDEPYLYQIGERGADSQVAYMWPAVRQQTAALAAPGPSVVVGFLRVGRPMEFDTILAGLPATEPLAANAFVNLDLAVDGRRGRTDEQVAEVTV